MAPVVLLAHLTGNPNSRQAALALAEAGWLGECHTTLGLPKGSPFNCLMPPALRSQMARRAFPEPVLPRLKTHPWWEMGRLLSRQGFLPKRFGGLFSTDTVARRFDRAVARRIRRGTPIDAVYGYVDSSLEMFQAARAVGAVTLYELPTPYWRAVKAIADAEAARLPAWAATLPRLDSDSRQTARRDAELQLADVVIVPSAFVRDSLKLAPSFQGEVVVVPYGCPSGKDEDGDDRTADCLRPSRKLGSPVRPLVGDSEAEEENHILRLLFVGTLSQSKGLADLTAAIAQLRGQVSLTIVGGTATATGASCPALEEALRPHRYLGVLPHAEVLAEMKRHDVFVLPTLYEGLALVLLEAMSCGLAVITTDRSGLAGLIEDGREGFLIPAQDSAALAARLQILVTDRTTLKAMRSAAFRWSQRHSWEAYRAQWRETLGDAIQRRRSGAG